MKFFLIFRQFTPTRRSLVRYINSCLFLCGGKLEFEKNPFIILENYKFSEKSIVSFHCFVNKQNFSNFPESRPGDIFQIFYLINHCQRKKTENFQTSAFVHVIYIPDLDQNSINYFREWREKKRVFGCRWKVKIPPLLIRSTRVWSRRSRSNEELAKFVEWKQFWRKKLSRDATWNKFLMHRVGRQNKKTLENNSRKFT